MADTKISALTSSTTPLAGTEVLPIVQSSTTVKVDVSNLTAGRAVSVGSLNSAGDATLGTSNSDLTQLGLTTTGEATDQKTWRFQTGTGIGTGILRLRALNDAGTSGQNAWLVNRTAENIDSQNFLTGGSNRLSIGATDVTLNTGNLVIGTSGKGIDFSATSHAAGMTSELLADYEEGTWTPVIADASTGGNLGSATVTFATYTKIGRQVTVSATLTNIVTAGMTAANVFYVRGLPFTSGSQQSTGVVRSDTVTFQSSTTYMTANITDIDSWVTFLASGSGIADVQVDCGDFSTGVSDLIFTITYFT